jgi:hypothetical protein
VVVGFGADVGEVIMNDAVMSRASLTGIIEILHRYIQLRQSGCKARAHVLHCPMQYDFSLQSHHPLAGHQPLTERVVGSLGRAFHVLPLQSPEDCCVKVTLDVLFLGSVGIVRIGPFEL